MEASIVDYLRQGAPACVSGYLGYMETIKGKSKETVQAYFYDLRIFFRFLYITYRLTDETSTKANIDISKAGGDILRRVTLGDLFAFLTLVSKERNNSAYARARKVATLKSFFNYALTKARLIESNPAAELESPKIVKRLPRYLDIDESKRLLTSAEEDETSLHARNYAMLTLFLNCGMRLSELVGINLQNIRGDTLTIIGKGDKERMVYLNAACKHAIEQYMKARAAGKVKDKNALFLSCRGTRISKNMVQRIIKHLLSLAGIDESRYSVHKLRHTAATLMYRYGNVDIRALQAILGHESIATTEIYTHLEARQLKEAADSNPLAGFYKPAATASGSVEV